MKPGVAEAALLLILTALASCVREDERTGTELPMPPHSIDEFTGEVIK